MDKHQAIISGINREMTRLEDVLKDNKEELVKQMENVDSRFGIAKYAEAITTTQAKIDALNHSLMVVNYVFNYKEEAQE